MAACCEEGAKRRQDVRPAERRFCNAKAIRGLLATGKSALEAAAAEVEASQSGYRLLPGPLNMIGRSECGMKKRKMQGRR